MEVCTLFADRMEVQRHPIQKGQSAKKAKHVLVQRHAPCGRATGRLNLRGCLNMASRSAEATSEAAKGSSAYAYRHRRAPSSGYRRTEAPPAGSRLVLAPKILEPRRGNLGIADCVLNEVERGERFSATIVLMGSLF
jgi:hypothetical protein